MRLGLPCLLVVALAASVGVSASAAPGGLDHNRYKWRDAAGNLHYGDSLPMDAARLGYEIVNPQGVVVRRIERAKTAEELAAAKTAATQAQAERNEAEARTRADAQLLAGFPEESDLRRSQQQRLEMLDQQLNSARVSLRSQEQTLADVLGRAADVERNGKDMPPALAKQLADLRKQVDDQRLAVGRRADEREQAIRRFDSETARYRALKAKRAEAQSPR